MYELWWCVSARTTRDTRLSRSPHGPHAARGVAKAWPRPDVPGSIPARYGCACGPTTPPPPGIPPREVIDSVAAPELMGRQVAGFARYPAARASSWWPAWPPPPPIAPACVAVCVATSQPPASRPLRAAAAPAPDRLHVPPRAYALARPPARSSSLLLGPRPSAPSSQPPPEPPRSEARAWTRPQRHPVGRLRRFRPHRPSWQRTVARHRPSPCR